MTSIRLVVSIFFAVIHAKLCNSTLKCDVSQYCHNSWCYDKQKNYELCYINEGCLSDRCNVCPSSIFDFTCGRCTPGFLPLGASCNYTEQCYITHCIPSKSDSKFCLGNITNVGLISCICVACSICLIEMVVLLPLNRKRIIPSTTAIIDLLLCIVILLCTALVLYMKLSHLIMVVVFIPNCALMGVIASGVMINTKSLKISGICVTIALIFINTVYFLHDAYYYDVSSEYLASYVISLAMVVVIICSLWKILISEYSILFIKNQ